MAAGGPVCNRPMSATSACQPARDDLLPPFTAGRIATEFVIGAVVGGLFGNLVSIVLSLLLVLGSILLSGGGWDVGAFVRGMILMPLLIGVWVVPPSAIFGLVDVTIHRAVRLVRGQGASVGSWFFSDDSQEIVSGQFFTALRTMACGFLIPRSLHRSSKVGSRSGYLYIPMIKRTASERCCRFPWEQGQASNAEQHSLGREEFSSSSDAEATGLITAFPSAVQSAFCIPH